MSAEPVRLDLLAMDGGCKDQEARPWVEAVLRAFFRDHDEVSAVRWTQAPKCSHANILVLLDVVFTLAGGGYFLANTARFVDAQHGELDPLAYALMADLLLFNADKLVAAFGVDVTVTAARGSDCVTSPSSP